MAMSASTLALISLFTSGLVLVADAKFDKKQCLIDKRPEFTRPDAAIPPDRSCPDGLIAELPSADSLAFVLDQHSLSNQRRVRRFKKAAGKPKSNTCYQRDEAVQFTVGTYNERKTVVIYFYGTENELDFNVDLHLEHKSVFLPKLLSSEFTKTPQETIEHGAFRVHKGFYDQLTNEHFERLLREKLMGIYATSSDDAKNQRPEQLVIGGRSLGASYAIMFYLMLVGDIVTAQKPGFHFLPTEKKKITVIPICSPMIVHHGDVHKIDEAVHSRIYNIITYRDPVVLILSGKQDTYKSLTYGYGTVLKHMTDDSLLRAATNGPVGKFIMFMRVDEKKKREVVVTVLDRKELYLSEGGKCLWKNTRLGVFAMKKLWPKYHRKQPYLDHIRHSCVYKYLQDESRYYKLLRQFYVRNGGKTKDCPFGCPVKK